MPSFLVTRRMSPALRARVQASLRSDLRQRTLYPNQGRRWKYLRVVLILATLALTAFLVLTYRKSRREVEERRALLLAEYRQLAASVPKPARARLQDLAARFDSRSLGDTSAGPALDRILAEPFLYVRVEALRLSSPKSALEAARESELDALATCLVTPPANLRESTLLRAIGQAPRSDRIFSVGDAVAALDFFDSSFEDELQSVQHMEQLDRLGVRLHQDERARGLAALEAKTLVLAVDLAKEGDVVSDFDGEAPHEIQLKAFDVASGRLLWGASHRVDPSWISAKSRLAYSRPLDSCRLAFELSVHAAPAPK